MQRTKIPYCTHTWNPIAMRCTPVSRGCDHCWHQAMARRHAANPYLRQCLREARKERAEPQLIRSELGAPSRLRKPAVIAVQFMGDLFHGRVAGSDINEVWMHAFNDARHRFLFLTKRAHNALAWTKRAASAKAWPKGDIWPDWTWLGVSVEDQESAEERIPILLQIPAARRWVSVEPMLGPVDIEIPWGQGVGDLAADSTLRSSHLDWVVCGAESGPKARPMDPQWARDLRDQCKAAGVPFFFKQMSGCQPIPEDLLIRESPW